MDTKVITIYEVFELNRILRNILDQQSSYNIQTAFKIHSLIKWLDETERFSLERMKLIFGDTPIDVENDEHKAFLSSLLPFVSTTLSIEDLLNTEGNIEIEVDDVEILEKLLSKTES